MYEFKDPTRLTRIAIWVVGVYLGLNAADALFALASLLGVPVQATLPDFMPDLAAAVNSLLIGVTLVSYVVVGRRIYRTNVNAPTFNDGMSVTPGWAIGWFFVPVANLFKPYQAMKETWIASHFVGTGGTTPGLHMVAGALAREHLPGPRHGSLGGRGPHLVRRDRRRDRRRADHRRIEVMRRLAGAQVATRHFDVFA
jgi:hypothetical protein